MASQSLYRKYRPQRFGEMVGQQHVITALRNAITDGRVGHAYLFSGPRGTGKTSTARLLAKALNCLDLQPDAEPCGRCENCVAIAAGAFFDLAELDAASNNGVDNVRDLVQSVNLGLAGAALRKVYIVDEVHMLSAAAANALLKTLEEPPAHVVFILATTEPQRVLPTIRSRTQHFDFTLLSIEEIQGHLASILEQEGVVAEAEAVALIARRAAGSDRDALSLLDQALALGAGRLDTEQVLATFGDTPFDRRVEVLEAVAADDPAAALGAVDAAMTAGVDARRLADDLLKTLRDAFVLAAGAGRVPYDGPADEIERLRALADAFGAAGMTRAIETLGQTIVDVRGPSAPDPRLLVEVAMVRLARRESRTQIEALLERVERLEKQLVDGGGPAATPAAAAAPTVPRPARPRAATPAPEPAVDLTDDAPKPSGTGPHLGTRTRRPAPPPPEAEPEASAEPTLPAAATAVVERPLDLDAVILAWSTTLTALSPPVRAAIQDAQPIGVDGNTIIFGVRAVRRETIAKKFTAEADAIRASLAAELGQEPRFSLKNHDFDAPDALAPIGSSGAATPAREIPNEPDLPDENDIDLRDLQDAPAGDAPVDSQTRLIEAFGAQIVEERPRA
ncbi:MAG TPA: DNA polymerase III subunit gamma/tau [Acidimicrobiia bacterium]|nr:DNA polymerase III subunit gamma/tau [Acidimicrobiia bacterium]